MLRFPLFDLVMRIWIQWKMQACSRLYVFLARVRKSTSTQIPDITSNLIFKFLNLMLTSTWCCRSTSTWSSNLMFDDQPKNWWSISIIFCSTLEIDDQFVKLIINHHVLMFWKRPSSLSWETLLFLTTKFIYLNGFSFICAEGCSTCDFLRFL